MSKEKALSVSELTVKIKSTLESSIGNIWIKGEISNFSAPASGHLYFTLKDDANQIKVAMFGGGRRNFGFKIEDGLEVIIFGKISIYGKRSEYQLIASEIEVLGIGNLLVEFEKLKQKLSEKGLFDAQHKKQIPEFPEKIGIVTSRTGAAIRDILNIIERRYCNTQILIYPVLVQGDEAPPQIVNAINTLNTIDDIDVILVTRGGGSIEDLWAFNDEAVAYAIYESEIPVISAVGHEIDTTIADYVADMRAPTPSAAAELVVPDRKELMLKIEQYKKKLSSLLTGIVDRGEERLKALMKSYAFKMPFEIYNDYVRGFDDVVTRLDQSIAEHISERADKIRILSDKLELLNPLGILKKGYSVVYNDKNDIITDSEKVSKGEKLRVKMYKGELNVIRDKD